MTLIQIDPPNTEARMIWETLFGLASRLESADWVLVGGLMVQLHALEHGQTIRPTTDIDLLGNSRSRPPATKRIAQLLDDVGTLVSSASQRRTQGLRWDKDGVPIDVLAPDGLKNQATTAGRLETLSIPGGTQALRRAETVQVAIGDGNPVVLRRPDLLGAILLKARVIMRSREKTDSDRQDFIRLLTLVESPRTLARDSQLKTSEKGWLEKARKRARFEDRSLLGQFSNAELTKAQQALDLLLTA